MILWLKLDEGDISMLTVKELSFAYKDQPIFEHLNFAVQDGEIAGLVAPNGTGKTTLLRLISGLLPTAKGTLTLNNISLHPNRIAYLKHLFFLENSNQLYQDLTVRDHLTYVQAVWHSKIDIDPVIESLGMCSYYKKTIKDLSLGMKQHVLLAMYMISDARLLLIDEPLNGLDPTSIQEFESVFLQLKAAGKSMIISSHQMDSVGRTCDRVFFLKDLVLNEVTNSGQDMMAVYNRFFPKVGA